MPKSNNKKMTPTHKVVELELDVDARDQVIVELEDRLVLYQGQLRENHIAMAHASEAMFKQAQTIDNDARVRTTLIDSMVQEYTDLMSRALRLEQRLEAAGFPVARGVFQLMGKEDRE